MQDGLFGHGGALVDRLSNPAKIAVVKRLAPIAADLGCTLAQMSLAWCLKNPHVSTVILGASNVDQVHENLGALAALELLTDDVMAEIVGIIHPWTRG